MSNELLAKLPVTATYKQIVGEIVQAVLFLGKHNFVKSFKWVDEELYLGVKV